MIDWIPIIVAVIFSTAIAIIDIKTFNLKKGYIPSILTTLFIVVELFIIGIPIGIFNGVVALTLALFLTDTQLFKGIADVKVFVALGITIPCVATKVPHVPVILIFTLFLIIISIVYQFLSKRYTKLNEIPFIPAILIAYLGTIFFI